MAAGNTTSDILALCASLEARLNAIRVGRITIRIQDGRVLTCAVEQEYRRNYEIKTADPGCNYEIKAADLGLDSTTTVVYNIGDINVPTP